MCWNGTHTCLPSVQLRPHPNQLHLPPSKGLKVACNFTPLPG